MTNLVIFAGTTEGRKLSQSLAAAGIFCHVCVATEYGQLLMEEHDHLAVHEGRMDADEMAAFFETYKPDLVIDASHPYATVVSQNIKLACKEEEVTYVRLARDIATEMDPEDGIICVNSAEEALGYVAKEDGNVLLTTGSKDLHAYQELIAAKGNIYARVIPSHESLTLCEEAGLTGRHVIAMQGPFSEEIHRAMCRELQITMQVTKSSGSAGGFQQKIAAARSLGIRTVVILPEAVEPGYTYDQVVELLEGRYNLELQTSAAETESTAEVTMHGPSDKGNIHRRITLVGMGPGGRGQLTQAGQEALDQAQVIYTAESLVPQVMDLVDDGKTIKPLYQWDRIWSDLTLHPGIERAAIAYSGDLGFYSGAANVPLSVEGADIVRLPGIGSMSYLSARTGISYQDAKIISLHGRQANWLWQIAANPKCFMIVSGKEDLYNVALKLSTYGLAFIKLTIGFNLGRADEEIISMNATDLVRHELRQGLYCLFIENRHTGPIYPLVTDQDMIRDKVPMTKAEVRHLSVWKMGISKGDVVYDIGGGTGSVACEIASLDDSVRVFTMDNNPDAVELIRKNQEHLLLSNMTVIEGSAPECLKGLPAPDAVFMGGTQGQTEAILSELVSSHKTIRLVANAVTIESLHELTEGFKKYGAEDLQITYLAVSRSKEVGRYHMMTAENGIYMISGTIGGNS